MEDIWWQMFEISQGRRGDGSLVSLDLLMVGKWKRLRDFFMLRKGRVFSLARVICCF